MYMTPDQNQASGAEIAQPDDHHGDEGLFQSPEFYVAAGFLVFIAILLWLGVHRTIAKALDDRSGRIAGQIEDARRLREEAQADLAKRQRRQREAAKEADAIIAQAEEDSRILMNEASAEIERMSDRRRDIAQQKISQAEQNAIKAVRAEAASIATQAARRVITEKLSGKQGDEAIRAVIDQLNGKAVD